MIVDVGLVGGMHSTEGFVDWMCCKYPFVYSFNASDIYFEAITFTWSLMLVPVHCYSSHPRNSYYCIQYVVAAVMLKSLEGVRFE